VISRRVRLVGSRIRDISRQFESNRTDTYRFYGTWQIPDLPGVPRNLRGATTKIRHNSTTDEIADKTPRTRALRVIPETDVSFNRLFGLSEDSESMNHHLKMTLLNGRARSVGRHRKLFDFHGYQAHVAITALLAWHHRTGADLSRWFCQWKPPNHAVSAAWIYRHPKLRIGWLQRGQTPLETSI